VERMVRPLWKPRDGKEEGPVRATVSTVVTFFLVLIAWNFFRANTLSDACYAMTHLWGGPSFRGTLGAVGMAFGGILKRVGCIGLLMVYDFFSLRHDLPKLMGKLKTPVRWGIYLAVTLAIIFLRPNTGAAQEFIYFQF